MSGTRDFLPSKYDSREWVCPVGTQSLSDTGPGGVSPTLPDHIQSGMLRIINDCIVGIFITIFLVFVITFQ